MVFGYLEQGGYPDQPEYAGTTQGYNHRRDHISKASEGTCNHIHNAAQAIAVASSPFICNDGRIAIPAIIYALLMNVVLLTYVAVIKWKHG